MPGRGLEKKRLIPRFWGQGLATEGSLAALEFGFCELHLDTVVAFAVEANTGSPESHGKDRNGLGSDFDHPSIPEWSPLRPEQVTTVAACLADLYRRFLEAAPSLLPE